MMIMRVNVFSKMLWVKFNNIFKRLYNMKKKWFVFGYKSKLVNVIFYINRLIDKLYDVFDKIYYGF